MDSQLSRYARKQFFISYAIKNLVFEVLGVKMQTINLIAKKLDSNPQHT